MYVRCVFVQYAAVCHYRQFVCVSGVAVGVRSGLWPDLTRTGAPDTHTCHRPDLTRTAAPDTHTNRR
jgi:hypothetical protein